MRVDAVGDLSVFVVDETIQSKAKYKYWISVGDFFHLLLSESTPMTTFSDLHGRNNNNAPGVGPSTKMIPLVVGLKVTQEISQEGKSAGAIKALEMFQGYINAHTEDCDTEEEGE